MKRIIAFVFAFVSALTIAINASAQTTESIWLTANKAAYKTGEVILANLNASSTMPIQGFTFQIRYDPSCLRPVNASSPISGMNGLPLPQLTGLVDGSYASTTPQSVNGTLAEVRFTALKECQTALYLESAALAIRNTEGFATLLPNVSIGERNIALLVDREVGVAHSSKQPESGSILPLDPPKADQSPQEFAALPWLQGLISTLLSHSSGFPGLIAGIMFMTLIGLLIFGTYKLFRFGMAREATNSKSSIRKRKAALHIKHGSQAGKSFVLNRLPILIGRDPQNDICLNDPNVISKHAKIYSERNRYYLRDLGGETFINGHKVRGGAVVLQSGDVVRLGKTAFFVFG